MSQPPARGQETDSLSEAQEIDRLCDRFEQAWGSPRSQTIEDVLKNAPKLLHVRLFSELLSLEIELHRAAGDRPLVEEYLGRFPDRAMAVTQAFRSVGVASDSLSKPRERDDGRTDEELASAYQAGDDHAAETLFERYYYSLRDLARQKMGSKVREVETPSDIVQTVLKSLFRRMRDGSVAVRNYDTLWPYLVTLTLNKIRDRVRYWRRDRRDLGRSQRLLDGDDPLERGPSPAEVLLLQEIITELLKKFPERRRQILERLIAGHGVSEIAQELGTSERTIYNTRIAAAELLDRLLEGDGQ